MFEIDKVFEIICGINAISNYAYDIHYSAKGKFFYSDHLFAERIGDTEEMSDEKDDLIETIYLGRGFEAPLSSDIAERVAEITPEVTDDAQLNFKLLRELIVKVLIDIETLSDLTRGEEDLLGTIAHILQRHNGLLFRQLSYTLEELQNSDDDVDWITVKGNHIPIPKGASEQEKSKAIEDFFRQRGSQSRAQKDVKKAFDRARTNEPKITRDVKAMAERFGVKNVGLDYRLKTEKSTMRKVKAEREENPRFKSDKDALNSLWDVVRYTQDGTADNVVSKGLDTLRALQEKGYKVAQIKNYWLVKDNPYKGINVKVLSPDGQKFEMQFNTPHNLEVKEEMHKYYELARVEKNAAKKKEYNDKMMELSTKYEPVKDYESFTKDALKGSEGDSGSGGVSGVRKKVESYRGKPEGTYDFRTGNAKEYTKGYSVTFHQNEADEKGGYKSHMGRYTDKEYDYLTNKVASEYGADVNVGVFDDEPEISFHTNSKRDAYKLMVKHNQHSIWDWKRGKIIVNKSYDKTKNPMRGDQ